MTTRPPSTSRMRSSVRRFAGRVARPLIVSARWTWERLTRRVPWWAVLIAGFVGVLLYFAVQRNVSALAAEALHDRDVATARSDYDAKVRDYNQQQVIRSSCLSRAELSNLNRAQHVAGITANIDAFTRLRDRLLELIPNAADTIHQALDPSIAAEQEALDNGPLLSADPLDPAACPPPPIFPTLPQILVDETSPA